MNQAVDTKRRENLKVYREGEKKLCSENKKINF